MIATAFSEWSSSGRRLEEHARCSPALVVLRGELLGRYGLRNLGCHAVRPIRGSTTTASTHSWGAAVDVSYRGLDRAGVLDEVVPWLVAWSGEWAIQRIHDYVGSRIWQAGRTRDVNEACSGWWRAQRRASTGMGQAWADWLHIEVHPNGWGDARTAAERGVS